MFHHFISEYLESWAQVGLVGRGPSFDKSRACSTERSSKNEQYVGWRKALPAVSSLGHEEGQNSSDDAPDGREDEDGDPRSSHFGRNCFKRQQVSNVTGLARDFKNCPY